MIYIDIVYHRSRGTRGTLLDMPFQDDDLTHFDAEGAPPLAPGDAGHVDNDGARIWYASYGSGEPVLLLHGGLGHSGNWGHQVPELLRHGYRVILIDSRGHGRSTRDDRPYTYELMASDVLRVLDALRLERTSIIGWSDGASTALVLAMRAQARVKGVFFFGCTMDPSRVKPIAGTDPIIARCFSRHTKDYARLSTTPAGFDAFVRAVTVMMQTEPHYTAEELAAIDVPITVVQAEQDEFIRLEDSETLARTIPGAELLILRGVSHFAPLQRPAEFTSAALTFLARIGIR